MRERGDDIGCEVRVGVLLLFALRSPGSCWFPRAQARGYAAVRYIGLRTVSGEWVLFERRGYFTSVLHKSPGPHSFQQPDFGAVQEALGG